MTAHPEIISGLPEIMHELEVAHLWGTAHFMYPGSLNY